MIQQTSSKLSANVFIIHVNCWTFAGSCKHPISRIGISLTRVCDWLSVHKKS